jgi:PIN domain nuclease of toxin-antitoxin system
VSTQLCMLDTHIAVALYEGKIAGLSARARNMLDADELMLSPAVVLELELLHEIQRLRFDAKYLLGALAQDFGVSIALDKFSAVALHSLSMSFTRDPFDRLITAHASLIKAPLITLDSRILDNYLGALS